MERERDRFESNSCPCRDASYVYHIRTVSYELCLKGYKRTVISVGKHLATPKL